ncbi:MAG: elongation factor P maturation arginine rhamnosyltransferase EarP [Proteobacteria bacterium]|nr:elongation factor P maturation arginine rhamnosyltransferase EarP [Pseudomonadota bacterium]
MSRSWDVFCRVVDNFGDAAVCWRLAQQLAAEHGGRVRLWIDDLAPLARLCPEIGGGHPRQVVYGVEILHWAPDAAFGTPADIAIDAFGGGLPEAYVESMAVRSPRPVWIVLEYLSAEPWVAGHHGLPSPHPRLPIERFFFFPGVVPGTGGVLREAALESRRSAFQSSPAAQAKYWGDLGFAPPGPAATVVSLFGYENPAVKGLLQAWSGGADPVVAAVTDSRLAPEVKAFLGVTGQGPGATARKGSLEARFLPFLAQPAYDELLWACDWNFVRGEDSFVRAQWARRPLVWQIYPQPDGAHLRKLEAFLAVYCEGLDPGLGAALRGLWQCWNEPDRPADGRIRSAWEALLGGGAGVRRHAEAWAGRLARPGDLAGNLAQYCEERLK